MMPWRWDIVYDAVVLWVELALGLVSIIILYGSYNVLFHPLRRYPGPLFWRAFRFPYIMAIHSGAMHRRLKTFHDKYGPIVRVAPNELSYTDAAAWKDIYGSRPGHQPFERNRIWFKHQSPNDPHSILGWNEDAHTRQRRAFTNSFSEKSLKQQAPILEKYVNTLIEQLKAPISGQQWMQKTVDLSQWFVYLAFDIAGDLSFAESFQCLQKGRAHQWVVTTQDFGKRLSFIASVNFYPPVDKLIRYVLPNYIRQKHLDHLQMSTAMARNRLAMDTSRPDWISPAREYVNQKDALSNEEWELNMTIIIVAGSETTASALTGIVRELLQNQGALHRVTQEIRSAFGEESDIKIASIGNLPYLNAVISEGLRIAPPTVIGIPRVVPKGGDIVCGQWVPGGTYVAYNQFSGNRQHHNFHHPNSFIPERFLHPHPADNMSSLQPFGLGRHSCIGMRLANAELRLTLARLLFAFDITLADQGDRWDWGDQSTYIFSWDKRALNVSLQRRFK